MAETTLVENEIKTQNVYGITPEMRKVAREKLEMLIIEQGIKPFTQENFYRKSESGESQAEIQADVDEFMQLREEWREDDKRLREARNK